MSTTKYKPVTSSISTRQEKVLFTGISGSEIVYTLCDRTQSTKKEANYFSSFNLPYEQNALSSGSTQSRNYPEIYQLNRDKIVIAPIPKQNYNEIIDGRSITISVPQYSGTTSISAKTVYSSTYNVLEKTDENTILGKNIAFLFCDDINKPYTGTTYGGTKDNKNNTTWGNSLTYTERPAAVSYQDLKPIDINTDKRLVSTVNFSNTVPEGYPQAGGNENTYLGYNYDIPVGFVSLDKGFIIFTHPSIVNNMPWSLGQEQYTNNSNPSSGTTNIYFSSTTTSNLSYIDISIEYKTTVVCLALPQEFYFSTNPSWDFNYNFNELKNKTNGYQSVYVTEIGLYNSKYELIAVAKLSEPLEKTYTNILNFTLNLDV